MASTASAVPEDNPAPPTATRRQHIETEITRLNQSIVQLKSQLNTLTPIAVLPPELLAEVFIHHAADSRSAYAHYHWIRVSHVCTHWRAVALSCPALWGNLKVTARQDWVTELLARTKKAPLTVTADFGYSHNTDKEKAFELVLKELARVRSLNVLASVSTMGKIMKMMDGPAPLLESLVLSGLSHYSMVDLPDPSLPRLLHSEQTARLQRLEVHMYPLRWSELTCRSLKHLKVVGLRETLRPRLEEVLSTLEQLPLLESLDLDEAVSVLPTDIAELPVPTKLVTLPCLRTLRMSAGMNDCTHALNHLTLPQLSALTLYSRAWKGAEELAACLTAKLPFLAQLPTVRIDKYGPGHVHIRGYDVRQSTLALRTESITPKLDLKFSDAYDSLQVLTTLCRCLPFAEVCNLHVGGVWFTSAEKWLGAFGHLKKVVGLRVCGESGTDTFLQALMHREPKAKSNGREAYTYFFPRLRVLTLDDVRFGDRETYDDGELGDFMEGLRNCLMERYEYGAEIRKLRLTHCIHMDETEVELLGEIVTNVWWDGELNIDESDEEEEEEDGEEFDDPLSYDDYQLGAEDLFLDDEYYGFF